jgi:hypothetical protein
MTLDSGAGHRIWQRLRRFLDWTMSPSTDLKQETKTEDSADRALIASGDREISVVPHDVSRVCPR